MRKLACFFTIFLAIFILWGCSHKGKKENIHFARIGKELILITIFGDDISLGLVRLRISQLAETIKKLFEERESGS